jgi:hypothetical protein
MDWVPRSRVSLVQDRVVGNGKVVPHVASE